VIAPHRDDHRVYDIHAGATHAVIVEIALRIGMFETLREPAAARDVAGRLAIGQRATEVLLTVLASSGLVTPCGGGCSLTDLARAYFLPESPFFKGALFRTLSTDVMELIRRERLQDGARPQTTDWLNGRVQDAREQGQRMHAHTFPAAAAFAADPLFGAIAHVLDVAGGVGTFSIALARRHPHLRCTVMDLPGMSAEARAHIGRFGVGDQVGFVARNMFAEPWDAGCDAVVFSNIFHDWEDFRCVELARRACDVLPPGGRVFVNEVLLDETKDGPLGAALFSASMMLNTQGRQFTFSELKCLLRRAGFEHVERRSSFGYYTLITAQKPFS
jgi:acetylserotonin N-methyltransferase